MTCLFIFIASIGFWPFGGVKGGPPRKKTALELPRNPEEFRYIRICLGTGMSEVFIDTDSPYRLLDPTGQTIFKGNQMIKTSVRVLGFGVQLGRRIYRDSPLTVESLDEGVRLNGRLYRHALMFWAESDGTLTVANMISIEDYLKGVLPWEANPKWSMEVLKAQAVASRTYALFKAIENQEERFDLSKDILSQVYGGKTSEKRITNLAVDGTEGEILTYGGKIFPAYFHSTCGGGTTLAEKIWDVEPHPVLQGVSCKFCHSSKHYRWQAEYSTREIEDALRKHGVQASGIVEIKTLDLDDFGRAGAMAIKTGSGDYKIRANDFRLWLGSTRLKSVLIDRISREGGTFIFRARGWGHGVGLCQYGAKTLSELGYGYREILNYYYPGAQIKKYFSAWSDRDKGYNY
ncbi:MAG: SpoIID/LytB domain-containing protein [Candidatus Omnitrophica bacterium]|nr:SpoIID/LytB domain-containing protein [Candidatus Omnitrophota bacterium]